MKKPQCHTIDRGVDQFDGFWKLIDELGTGGQRWREVADKLAQRLRSILAKGATRFPDARDRAALKEYDTLVKRSHS
jgi:hypothetical protein